MKRKYLKKEWGGGNDTNIVCTMNKRKNKLKKQTKNDKTHSGDPVDVT
jgi:hypothetical protein